MLLMKQRPSCVMLVGLSLFNKVNGIKLLKLSPSLLKKAEVLRDTGMSYKEVSEKMEVSTMTVYRALNKKTKALESLLERS